MTVAYANPIPFASGVLLGMDNFDRVDGFTCVAPGVAETPFEQEVRDWLIGRGRDSAYEAIRLAQLVEVRLFYHDDGRLIGYGAIGPVEWELDDHSKVTLCLLHFCGIHTQFRYKRASTGRIDLAGASSAACSKRPKR